MDSSVVRILSHRQYSAVAGINLPRKYELDLLALGLCSL
jgi:hypothetical protein